MLNSNNLIHQNKIERLNNDSLGFIGDTAVTILCVTAYPGVLAADIIKKFPKVMTGIIAFGLFSKASSFKVSSNDIKSIAYNSHENNSPSNALPLCNDIKPQENDLHNIRLHSKCLLTYAKQANPEHVIEHKLSDEVLKNINNMSTIIPAVSV
ncbi:TPA: hypothetical protein ACN362_004606 [Vibrio parahaemolyticus]